MSNHKSKVDAQTLRALARVCLKNSEYDFVHGDHGRSFFDVDELSSQAIVSEDGKDATAIFDNLVEWISERSKRDSFNTLVFIERDTGPIGLVGTRTEISQKCGLPSIVARPAKRLLCSRLKGKPLHSGDRVAIVTDVATTGHTIAEAADTVWRTGAIVAVAFALVDNEYGAKDYLSGLDIELDCLTLVSELQQHVA